MPSTKTANVDELKAYRPGATIDDWRPEDPAFWSSIGQRVARRNLWTSVPALFLAFAVWMVWSMVVVALPAIGYTFTTSQLFWLAALPGLSGATLRIFYSFLVPIAGGRNWSAFSTATLLIPAIGMGFAVQNLQTPYWVFVALALTSGFGGGNFASSMSNISFFFPRAQKGAALGINAGLGNLGVSAVQFIAPLVIGVGILRGFVGGPQSWQQAEVEKTVWLQNAAFVWAPLIAVSTIACWLFMNNLTSARASFREQSIIFRRKHNWIMCCIYTGTFGSFIGYSAALPLFIKTQFPGVNPLHYAWMGPFVGALIRPIGGWLADKLGGARVTFWNFIVMILAVLGVIFFLHDREAAYAFPGFLTMFILLFLTTGIGNGSTFRMVPIMFLTFHERLAAGRGAEGLDESRRNAAKEGAAVLGFSSAIAAYGAFIIPKTFGYSITATGQPFAALWFFVAFYVVCLWLTWWNYSRRGADLPC